MRVYKRIGDIYEVKFSDFKRYFQYLQSDSAYLGGDIIALFSKTYSIEDAPLIGDIVTDKVEYFCHTIINNGVRMGLWCKYGSSKDYPSLANVYFKNFVDMSWLGITHWHIWQAGGKLMEFKELPDEFKSAYTTYVFPPNCVYHKLKTGKFLGFDF